MIAIVRAFIIACLIAFVIGVLDTVARNGDIAPSPASALTLALLAMILDRAVAIADRQR